MITETQGFSRDIGTRLLQTRRVFFAPLAVKGRVARGDRWLRSAKNAVSRYPLGPGAGRAPARRPMLLAVARLPTAPDAIAVAARALALAPADVAWRLQGLLPRILLADADGERIAGMARALEERGFAVFTLDPVAAPSDADRLIARRLELDAEGFTAFDSAERSERVPAAAILLVQQGARVAVETLEETKKTKKLSPTRAVLSGGLLLRKTVETKTKTTTETRDAFALVERGDGGPAIALYERRLHYQFLGAAMQSSSFANLRLTIDRLRTLAPAARFDDRVARPGFVTGGIARLCPSGVDPVDLALHLVALAVARGA